MHQQTRPSLVQIMACRLFGAKPLSEPTNWQLAGILLIGPLKTNFSEMWIEIHFSLTKMHLKISSGKWWPFCLSLIVLTLNVRGPSYLRLTRSISWLLMPWLLTLQDISSHDIDYIEIFRSFSYSRKCFKYLCQINVEEWHKIQIYMFMFPQKNLARKELNCGWFIFCSMDDLLHRRIFLHQRQNHNRALQEVYRERRAVMMRGQIKREVRHARVNVDMDILR